jgi:hypothetical protein
LWAIELSLKPLARYPGVTAAIDASAATKLSQQQEQCEQSAKSKSG